MSQGSVGDCWLLSGISALAEFEGAIRRIFRRTDDLEARPKEGANLYTVTLWDLPSWREVDVAVDERLVRTADGRSLVGCKMSGEGELWVCYLEKALAAHCGGWDKIDGGQVCSMRVRCSCSCLDSSALGSDLDLARCMTLDAPSPSFCGAQCTHAWALLTGCKEQYVIRRRKSGKWGAGGTFNPNEKRWEPLANSPHDGFQGLWPVGWPDVGGGGDLKLELVRWSWLTGLTPSIPRFLPHSSRTGHFVCFLLLLLPDA